MQVLEVVTNTNCNLDCGFCFASRKNNVVLNFEDFVKVYEYAISENKDEKLLVKIYGGESMLSLNLLKDIIKYVIDNHYNAYVSIALITNGTVIDEEIINMTCNNTVPFSITYSLEYSEDEQNIVRKYKDGKPSFDVIMDNIHTHLKLTGDKRVGIQTVLTPNLLGDIEKYISFMEKHKDVMFFNLVPMFDDTYSDYNIHTISNMHKLFTYYKECFVNNNFYHIGLFQVFRSITSLFNLGFNGHCLAGCGQISIVPTGDIYPCSIMYHNENENLKYGNSNNFIDSYNMCKSLYKDLTKHDMECNLCQSKYNFGCLGTCLAHKLEDKSIKYVCEHNKEFGRLSKWLNSELNNNEYYIDRLKEEMLCQTNESVTSDFLNFIRRQV